MFKIQYRTPFSTQNIERDGAGVVYVRVIHARRKLCMKRPELAILRNLYTQKEYTVCVRVFNGAYLLARSRIVGKSLLTGPKMLPRQLSYTMSGRASQKSEEKYHVFSNSSHRNERGCTVLCHVSQLSL